MHEGEASLRCGSCFTWQSEGLGYAVDEGLLGLRLNGGYEEMTGDGYGMASIIVFDTFAR